MTNNNDTPHTEDEVIEAVKNRLTEDFNTIEREDLEVKVTSLPEDDIGRYAHAEVTFTEATSIFTDYSKSYIQSFRVGSESHDISIVAEPERIGLE